MTPTSKCEFIPYLSITDASAAVSFYSAVFGIDPTNLLTMPDGRIMHCEFDVGGSRIFLSEELPEHGGTPSPTRQGATTVAIHVYVDDFDGLVQSMLDHGADVLMEPSDMFWGERFARVRDPFGHEWGIATKTSEMTHEEIRAAAEQMFDQLAE
ncbi:MAG: VOC family protein [Planctomycetota bacterium]